MNATGRDPNNSRAEMAGTGDVVGCVANDDELLGLKLRIQGIIDSFRGKLGEIASIERFIAECARQREEFCEPAIRYRHRRR